MKEIVIKMSIVVFRASNLQPKSGFFFWFFLINFIEPPLKSSPHDKMLPSFKRGAIYLPKSVHKT